MSSPPNRAPHRSESAPGPPRRSDDQGAIERVGPVRRRGSARASVRAAVAGPGSSAEDPRRCVRPTGPAAARCRLVGGIWSMNSMSRLVKTAGLSRLLAWPAPGITAYLASGSRSGPCPHVGGDVTDVVELSVHEQRGHGQAVARVGLQCGREQAGEDVDGLLVGSVGVDLQDVVLDLGVGCGGAGGLAGEPVACPHGLHPQGGDGGWRRRAGGGRRCCRWCRRRPAHRRGRVGGG